MKAIILTSQRSGSTFLQESLDAHPAVKCYPELLIGGNLVAPGPLRGKRRLTKAWRYVAARAWNPVGIMERYYDRNEARIVAFKAMYNHVDNRRVRNYLSDHREIRVIHLRRDNLLKQHVSKLLLGARREKAWQPHTDHAIPPVQVRVSPQHAMAEMRRVHEYFTDFEKFLSKHRKIELVYERLFNGPALSNETWKKVSELLEIDPVNAGSDWVKMNPNDLRPMVENYDEVAAALVGTEFARFLDPE